MAISTGAQVQKGKSVVFTAVPAEGFKLKEWKLNGVAVAETSTTYTLSDLSAAATVSVDFEIVTGTGNSFADNLQVYPNPFTDVVNIKGAGNGALQIMDVAGTNVYKQKVSTDDEDIHLERLSAGVYFLHIEKNKQLKVVKIIKK